MALTTTFGPGLNNLVALYKANGNPAEPLHREWIEIVRKVHGDVPHRVAISMNIAGLLRAKEIWLKQQMYRGVFGLIGSSEMSIINLA